MTVANQRIIKIHKDNKQNPPFVQLSIKAIGEAYRNLNNAYAFYLYLCLCCNADGFSLEFSPQRILNDFCMPVSTTQDQFKRLIEKGYLVQKKEGSNVYDFYAELPQKESKPTSFSF